MGRVEARQGGPLRLEGEERCALERWAAEVEVSAPLARRAAVILCLADGCSQLEAAGRCGVSQHLVGRWRRRFMQARLAGLLDLPRPGPAPRIDRGLVARIRDLTLEGDAPGGCRWTSRSLAAALGVSQSSIVRTWRALGVGYTRRPLLDLGTPPPEIWGESEVAGMYLAPPERLFAVRVKAGSRGAGRAAGSAIPTGERRRVLGLLSEVEGRASASDRGNGIVEAWRFLDALAATSPAPWEVHLLAAGELLLTAAPLRRWLRGHPEFHLHRAGTWRSWPESVERWCSGVFSSQGVRMRHRPRELGDALGAWLARTPAGGSFAWAPPAGAPGPRPVGGSPGAAEQGHPLAARR